MKMFVLKNFAWEGRAYRPGEFITVRDHNIAQLMSNALWAIDAGETHAPAPRRTAWAGHTQHAAPLRGMFTR
jgi:hypothetical protein